MMPKEMFQLSNLIAKFKDAMNNKEGVFLTYREADAVNHLLESQFSIFENFLDFIKENQNDWTDRRETREIAEWGGG